MHRQNILQLLINYNPLDTAEIIAKQRMLEFVRHYRDCFARDCEGGHFTASCWLVNSTFDKALLMHHVKLDLWIQLGGHSDGEPDLLRVAIKEAQEESGLKDIAALSNEIFDLDIHRVPAYGDELEHLHYDVRFLLQAKNEDNLCQNSEAKKLIWVTSDVKSLPTHDASVMRMYNKWQLLKIDQNGQIT